MFRHVPSAPHCKMCEAPFRGIGGALLAPLGYRQWPKSPRFCQSCRRSLAKFGLGGAEVPVTMLFADLRDSTGLAERMRAADFGRLLNRFYLVADAAIADHQGIVERHMGDGVVGQFLPVFAGAMHAAQGLASARELMAKVRSSNGELWAPVGIGLATGTAYVGVVADSDEPDDFTTLGDVVNTAARLGSVAAAGEILLTAPAAAAAGVEATAENSTTLELKGKSEPIPVVRLG
jgi:adenylate cyclase